MLVKVKVEKNSSDKNKLKRNAHEISKVTYKSLGLVETALEEFLQDNIELLTQEEDYDLMVIGKQVRNSTNKRTDLVALDNNGNIVIIEIKRDEEDMKARKDNFESQAIRYAASFTQINTVEELVEKVYVNYLIIQENVEEESSYEEGVRRIKEFLMKNDSLENFNHDQRIILVASSFDLNVLSASAWLSSRGVDISCFEISPQVIVGEEKSDYLLEIKRLLPLGTNEDYYTEIYNSENKRHSTKRSNKGTRRKFAQLTDMIEAGIVSEGDEIYFKNRPSGTDAIIYGKNEVEFNGKILSLNEWAKQINGKKINGYECAVVKGVEKTLSELRSNSYHLFDGMEFDSIR